MRQKTLKEKVTHHQSQLSSTSSTLVSSSGELREDLQLQPIPRRIGFLWCPETQPVLPSFNCMRRTALWLYSTDGTARGRSSTMYKWKGRVVVDRCGVIRSIAGKRFFVDQNGFQSKNGRHQTSNQDLTCIPHCLYRNSDACLHPSRTWDQSSLKEDRNQPGPIWAQD